MSEALDKTDGAGRRCGIKSSSPYEFISCNVSFHLSNSDVKKEFISEETFITPFVIREKQCHQNFLLHFILNVFFFVVIFRSDLFIV